MPGSPRREDHHPGDDRRSTRSGSDDDAVMSNLCGYAGERTGRWTTTDIARLGVELGPVTSAVKQSAVRVEANRTAEVRAHGVKRARRSCVETEDDHWMAVVDDRA